MRALINGSYAPLEWSKGANHSATILIVAGNGEPTDLTGGAVSVLVYDRSDRANAPIATHVNDTLTTPTAGLATLAIDDSELTYGPGDYFAFVRFVATGGEVYFAAPYALSIK